MTTEQEELVSLKNLFLKELCDIRVKMKEFKSQLLLFVDDNRRLTNEVKESIQYRISVTELVDNISVLEQTLHEAIESRNIEVKSLITEERNDGIKFHDIKDEGLEKRIMQVQEHYKKGMSILTRELHDARNQIKNLKEELHQKGKKYDECDIFLKKCNDAIARKEKLVVEFEKKEAAFTERIVVLECDLADNREELKTKIQEFDELQGKNRESLCTIDDLRRECLNLMKSLSKAKKEGRLSLAKAEAAVFEKNELKLKEEYAEKRVQLVQASIDKNIQNLASQYKEYHQKAMDNQEKVKKTLSVEIQMLKDSNLEKHDSLKKTRRENERIHSMLESLRNENLEHCISTSVYSELSGKLSECERARDDAVFQQTLLESKLKEVERMSSTEIDFYKAEAKYANENLRTLTESLAAIVPEREAMAEEIEERRNECETFRKEILIAKQLLENEISDYKEAMSVKTRAFNAQLKTMSENYMKRINELEILLTTQQAVSRKWKDIALQI